ncbi:DUF6517 family protein [Halovenus rubra]|uniref:DUF6517 family protein n=2 Tax=Halovenus rubra TaxID=869890 RepID=A0ABD5XB35_9EURY|nr:DUF6517 family protein [Halovenus rubra]
METRRSVLGVLGVAGVASLAGCGVLQDTFEQNASPAGVEQPALDQTGFEHRQDEEIQFTRTVDALGQSRDLRLTNWLVTHGKGAGDVGADAATFRIFSTPSVTVAGNEINPIDNFDDEQLLAQVSGQQGSLEAESTQVVSILGTDVELTRYKTQREVAGAAVTVFVHVGRLSNNGDLLTVVGAYPELLDESEKIYSLARAVEHPG